MFFPRNDIVGLGRRSSRAVSSTIDVDLPVGRVNVRAGVPLLLLMTAAVFLLRLPFINFSVLSDDESVYLMVGEALRHGALPYVDIIDRKPLGIYLIFAFADWAFRDAVIGARVLGALSTCGAAVLLKWFGQRALGLTPVAGCGVRPALRHLCAFVLRRCGADAGVLHAVGDRGRCTGRHGPPSVSPMAMHPARGVSVGLGFSSAFRSRSNTAP